MLSPLLRTIAARRLLAPGDRVLVAVSGGPDSMALLHGLWEARERLGIALEVASVDHGLRVEAAAELALVEERARALELPFHRLGVGAALDRWRGLGAGLQEAARRARLDALAELAGVRGARRVALGHTADDQAETVLFRILRGTGVAGLAGIPYQRGPFVRPLLDVRRKEILLYLRRRSIPFVEDPSNTDPRFARARVRHQILPRLAEENPRVAEALLGLSASARDLPSEARVSGRRRGATSPPPPPSEDGRHRAETATASAVVEVVIDRPGTYRWSDSAVLEVRVTPAGEGPRGTIDGVEGLFDADRLVWPLRARRRLPGDRMRPRGGRGSRKLSDLMIDAKIARRLRGELPVLTSATEEVLFVPGLRPSETGLPSASTRRALTVAYLLDEA